MSDEIPEDVTEAVIARIKDRIEELRSVEEAADLADMIEKRTLPSQFPACIVLWSGDRAKPGEIMNIVRQDVTSVISVILLLKKAGDATGTKGSTAIGRAIKRDLISAMVGWQPSSDHDPCEYAGGRLLGLQAGVVFIQLDFSTCWWIRQET